MSQWMYKTLLDGHYPIAILEWLSTFRDMDLHTNIQNLELGNEGEGNNLSFWSIPHPSQLPWDDLVCTMTFPSFYCFLEETWGIVTRRTNREREWRGNWQQTSSPGLYQSWLWVLWPFPLASDIPHHVPYYAHPQIPYAGKTWGMGNPSTLEAQFKWPTFV